MPLKIDDKVFHVWKMVQKLDDIPRKLSIQGFLKNIVEGKLSFSVYVDKWPNCNAIIVKPRTDYINKYPVYRLGIYSKDATVVKSMLSKPDFLPNSVNIQLFGIAQDLLPALESASMDLGRKVKIFMPKSPKNVIETEYKPETLEEISKQLSSTFYSSSIKPENVGCIADAAWDYWKDFYDSKEQFEQAIEMYRSMGADIGIYEKSTDNLAAWMLSNIDKSSIMAQTLPKYQGHNLQLWVIQGKTSISVSQQDYCYSYFRNKRTLSEKAQKLLGARVYDNLKFIDCVITKKVKCNI